MRFGIAAIRKLAQVMPQQAAHGSLYGGIGGAGEAAAGVVNTPGQYYAQQGQGMERPRGYTPTGISTSEKGTQDVLKAAIVSFLPPALRPLAGSFLNPLLAGVPNTTVTAGRTGDQGAREEEKLMLEAMQFIGAEDFGNSVAGGIQRLLAGNEVTAQYAPVVGNWIRSIPPDTLKPWMPVLGAVTNSVPGLFPELSNQVDQYAVAKQLAQYNGDKVTPEYVKQVPELLKNYTENNVFPPSIADTFSDADKLSAIRVALEQNPDQPPEQLAESVQRAALQIDLLVRRSGGAITTAAASNAVRRLSGGMFDDNDFTPIEELGDYVREITQQGGDPGEVLAHVQQRGYEGLVHYATTKSLESSPYVGDDPQRTLSRLSHASQYLGNAPEMRHLDALWRHGSERQRAMVEKAIADFNNAESDRETQAAWKNIQNLRRQVGRSAGASTAMRQGPSSSGPSVLAKFRPGRYGRALSLVGSSYAREMGAGDIAQFLEADPAELAKSPEAYEQFRNWVRNRPAQLDPRSLSFLAKYEDNPLESVIRYKLEQVRKARPPATGSPMLTRPIKPLRPTSTVKPLTQPTPAPTPAPVPEPVA